jgi:hypothetical protein
VLAIFVSALVALGQTIERFIHPRAHSHLWLLAAAIHFWLACSASFRVASTATLGDSDASTTGV